ncbi:hypothetical protein X801_08617 [Opisthorchis viverrini]|uniref:Uncharacterized protein n=1 Tax=Opisthorchis viverrini TaxID=6198 RepID=A0A1S8WM69_OPIVI|nr:hypothetical protein X801_08617 [Opisthorchis viverrini]
MKPIWTARKVFRSLPPPKIR